MVWPCPMGKGLFSYASARRSGGTNSCRGTALIAWITEASNDFLLRYFAVISTSPSISLIICWRCKVYSSAPATALVMDNSGVSNSTYMCFTDMPIAWRLLQVNSSEEFGWIAIAKAAAILRIGEGWLLKFTLFQQYPVAQRGSLYSRSRHRHKKSTGQLRLAAGHVYNDVPGPGLPGRVYQ